VGFGGRAVRIPLLVEFIEKTVHYSVKRPPETGLDIDGEPERA
jgi:hypothetical protein